MIETHGQGDSVDQNGAEHRELEIGWGHERPKPVKSQGQGGSKLYAIENGWGGCLLMNEGDTCPLAIPSCYLPTYIEPRHLVCRVV